MPAAAKSAVVLSTKDEMTEKFLFAHQLQKYYYDMKIIKFVQKKNIS